MSDIYILLNLPQKAVMMAVLLIDASNYPEARNLIESLDEAW